MGFWRRTGQCRRSCAACSMPLIVAPGERCTCTALLEKEASASFKKLCNCLFNRDALRLLLGPGKESRGFNFAYFELRRIPVTGVEGFLEIFVADPSLHLHRTMALVMVARIFSFA